MLLGNRKVTSSIPRLLLAESRGVPEQGTSGTALTAPHELAGTLHCWLCRRCVHDKSTHTTTNRNGDVMEHGTQIAWAALKK